MAIHLKVDTVFTWMDWWETSKDSCLREVLALARMGEAADRLLELMRDLVAACLSSSPLLFDPAARPGIMHPNAVSQPVVRDTS
jgi:hypothetical protein